MNVYIGDRVNESGIFTIGGKNYDAQQLLSKLRFLSKIRKNEKLHLENQTLVEDTWYTSILRTLFHDEGRKKALTFIKETCNEALCTIEALFSSGDPLHREIGNMIVSSLNEAQGGIMAYVETYKKDRRFISDVESYLTILKVQINNVEKMHPSVETM